MTALSTILGGDLALMLLPGAIRTLHLRVIPDCVRSQQSALLLLHDRISGPEAEVRVG